MIHRGLSMKILQKKTKKRMRKNGVVVLGRWEIH